MEGAESEQKLIEKYLKQFCIEECLDEVLNYVVTERPSNPYTAIAQAIELKTLPEILDIRLFSYFYQDQNAVKAVLETNIGSFTGHALYSPRPPEEGQEEEGRDYPTLEQALREVLLALDPRQIKPIDEAVKAINRIDPAESLAVSLAACKAAARFHNCKLHEFVADSLGLKRDDMALPVPSLTIASRDIGYAPGQQNVFLLPVKTSDLEAAMDKLRNAVRYLAKGKKTLVPTKYDASGVVCYENTMNVEEIVTLCNEVLREQDMASEMKLGVQYNAEKVLRLGEGGAFTSTYAIEGNALKSGQDIVERLVPVWQDNDLVAVDDLLVWKDTPALKYLKKRVTETVYDLKNAGSDKLAYCLKGIGNDQTCSLQVYTDCSIFDNMPDFDKLLTELPCNTIKIVWNKMSTVSDMIEYVKKAKKAHLPVALQCTQSLDEMDVYFATGAAASQFLMGGLYSSESARRLNVMLDLKRQQPTLSYMGKHFRVVH